jgi:hypothetical protein
MSLWLRAGLLGDNFAADFCFMAMMQADHDANNLLTIGAYQASFHLPLCQKSMYYYLAGLKTTHFSSNKVQELNV